jgi:hypothetical protein
MYIAANALCIIFKVQSAAEAAARAGALAVINLLFPFGGFHLSFLADSIGISLRTCRVIHRLTGSVSFILACSHAFIMLRIQQFRLSTSENFFGLLVRMTACVLNEADVEQAIASLCLLVFLFSRHVRPLLYEVFLRFHQALAVFCAYAIYVHLPPSSLSKTYLYTIASVCLLVSVAELVLVGYRNGAFRHGTPRAQVSQKNGILHVSLRLRQPVKMRPGQYINLWIPAAGVRTFFQSHPFVVQSWTDGQAELIELFIVPQRGFTRQLLRLSGAESAGPSTQMAMFSGPHGHSAPVRAYETVLMFASGSGIAAQLPYLRQLVFCRNSHQAQTRRAHLVWLVKSIGEPLRPR